MANSYARLGEGDRSLECLELLTRGSMGPNLFTYHNDWREMGLTSGGAPALFQIDANFGITAAVLEMLVFSKPGLVKLLPALPTKWSSGKVTGIRCRGGLTVDMEWDDGCPTRAVLWARPGRDVPCVVQYADRRADVVVKSGQSLRLVPDDLSHV